MAAVTEAQLLKVQERPGDLTEISLAAGEVLYANTVAFIQTDGYAAAAFAAGSIVAGVVAHRDYDNTGGANGDVKAEVYTKGKFHLPYPSVAQANVGDLAHAIDNHTLGAAGGAVFGMITRVVETDVAECDMERRVA